MSTSSYKAQIKEIRELLGVPDNHELMPHVRSLVTQWRATGEPVSPQHTDNSINQLLRDLKDLDLWVQQRGFDQVSNKVFAQLHDRLATAPAAPAVVVDEAMVLAELVAAIKERDEAHAAWDQLTGRSRQYPGPEYQRSRKASERYNAALAAAALKGDV